MGRVFLCVSAACVQRRRSGRYSPIDRTGLSDCQREFIFPTISLSLSLSIFLFLPSGLLSSYLLTPAALFLFPSLARAHSIAIRSPLPSVHRDSLFPPSFPSLLSPSPAHHNRSSPAYLPWPLFSLYILCFFTLFLFSSLPPPSVVCDNSLVCSLITLRVYTAARTKQKRRWREEKGRKTILDEFGGRKRMMNEKLTRYISFFSATIIAVPK